MKKRMLVLVGVIILLGGLTAWKTPYLRDAIGRHFGSVSSKNAITKTRDAINTKYPEKNLTWIHGEYKDKLGKWDDLCYTSDFMVDEDVDNVLSGTYCDANYASVWKGNEVIDIAVKAYERKITLVNRLAQNYTTILNKDIAEKMTQEFRYPLNMSIITPYSDTNYLEELPNQLEYGMEFSKEINLRWEFNVIIKDYDALEYNDIIERIIKYVEEGGYSFENYNFIFVDGVNNATYIYDITLEMLKTESVDEMLSKNMLHSGEYAPYGDENKY